MPPESGAAEEAEPDVLRPFWSGTLSFGLVSVPVDLYAGQRRGGVSMRMLAPDGVPLIRRYFCPAHDKELESEEIVRGHEYDDGDLVVVTDEELEALAPDKSRDIELRVFVPRDEIPPLYLDRAYFLTPSGDSTKAYQLLAQTMERTGRVGIATFVMRGKEYLIAIFADNGILHAQTLRFEEEVRTPSDIGLPTQKQPNTKRVTAIKKQIRKLAADELDVEQLVDVDTERLREKVAAEAEVLEAPQPGERPSADVVDLMAVLKQKLQGQSDQPANSQSAGGRRGQTSGKLEKRSRDELYEQARQADIPGRSKMNKDELIDALRAKG